ncbi:PRC-barrel domain containing protein [Streptacidiphilus monticola]
MVVVLPHRHCPSRSRRLVVESGLWDWTQAAGYETGIDLTRFSVEATDDRIGKIDKHSNEAGAGYLVVDTGVWIFGKHVLLPAGLISSIDVVNEVVRVDRTREEIKAAPEFDKDQHTTDPGYHAQLGSYYHRYSV